MTFYMREILGFKLKMKNVKLKIYNFFEEMLFFPKWYHWPIIILFLPFSFVYMSVLHFKFPRKFEDLGIPIISVGNIIVGGSGKTPFVKALANELKEKKVAVVLRGYKRKSKGLLVVKNFEKILVDVDESGDEAMEIVLFSNAAVIVSEDRKEGIIKAKEIGAEVVILDDGFDKPFEKLNIVLDEKIKNPFTLPAGGYRYPRVALRYADIVIENLEKEVTIPKGDILISGISKPRRLLKYWSGEYKFFPDHYEYKWEDLKEYKNKKVVTTEKDYVKLKKFPLNLEVMKLNIKIPEEIKEKIFKFLIEFQ